MQQRANDRQVGGTHYAGTYQHWDWATDVGLLYLEGQVAKYVQRWRKKNGLQDVEKAQHFLDKVIELAPVILNYKAKLNLPVQWVETRTGHYLRSNNMSDLEAGVTLLMAKWRTVEELQLAKDMLDQLVSIITADRVEKCVEQPDDESIHARQPS